MQGQLRFIQGHLRSSAATAAQLPPSDGGAGGGSGSGGDGLSGGVGARGRRAASLPELSHQLSELAAELREGDAHAASLAADLAK